MKYETFEKFITILEENRIKCRNFYDSLPSSLRGAFCDNDYIQSLEMTNDKIIELFMGEHSENVSLFLYENRDGAVITVSKLFEDDKVYDVSTLEGYLKFAKENICE